MPILLALLLLVQADELAVLKKKYEEQKKEKSAERADTLHKIGRLKTESAAEFLVLAFEKEGDKTCRRAALQALGTCATSNATRHLVGVAEREYAEATERGWALDAAVGAGSREGLVLAIGYLTQRQEPDALREAAGASLLKHVKIEKTEKAWRKVLGDSSDRIRAQALQALAPLKDPQVLGVARAALVDPKQSSVVRKAAVEVWRLKAGAPAVKLLLDAPIADDGVLRAAVTSALARLSADEECFEALVSGIAKANAETRAAGARALAKSDHVKSIYVLQSLFADRAIAVRIAAMESAAERGSDEVLTLLKEAAKKGEDEATETAIGLLAGFPYPATVEYLMKLCSEVNKPHMRVAVIDALARIGSADAFPIFEAWVGCLDVWQARAASVRGLSKIKTRESVDLLIRRMGFESGRLLADMAAALEVLTGKSLGLNPEHWEAWWKVKRETFTFDGKPEEGKGSSGGTMTYHDIPVLSRRVMFLLDISGSMKEERKETTRLGEAKAELTKVLKALPKDARVNLIFFNSGVDAWQPRMVTIGPNLAKAVAAVEALKAGGGTNIHDSVEKAFDDPEVDTIYLLSDGSPSTGKYVASADVLREVRRFNRTRQVVIHAISLGASSFMKQLAADNGGRYQEIK